MTFELSPEHAKLRDRARAFAAAALDRGDEIDRHDRVPVDLREAGRPLCETDSLGLAVVVEEVASASAALALDLATADAAGALGLAGLRGAPVLPDEARTQLVLAAAALGLGRRALDAAVSELRRSAAAPGADVEKPHWVVADAATELDAARLLTYKAARTMAGADIAVARLLATSAATRAVETALRVTGPAALQPASILERLSRDVRALGLIVGTEEQQRTTAADGLLPD